MQAILKAMQNTGLKVNVEAVNYDGEYRLLPFITIITREKKPKNIQIMTHVCIM